MAGVNYFEEFLIFNRQNLAKSTVKIIRQQPELISQLVDLALSEKNPSAWRAAWSLRHLAEDYPEILLPYISNIVKFIPLRTYHSQQGCLLGVIAVLKPDVDLITDLIDLCVEIISTDMMPTYRIRYSIDILIHIADFYPELKREFADLIICSAPNWSNQSMKKAVGKWIKRLK